MGCFLNLGDKIYITEFDNIEDITSVCGNAIIEKEDVYWKVNAVKNFLNTPLNPKKHVAIKNNVASSSYCNLCKERLRAIHSMCRDCSFKPNQYQYEISTLDNEEIIQFLKSKGCYEVDKTNFNKEIHYLKKNIER